ncbi:hypothetical protein EUX98_g5482 [Antrodiella citrinella]|uniref:G-patch domain-containing protein n=1 Tax=Antrodiella citrinella TaxID=2447956 RepID=A0A4S4MRC3_9APHY|nr:hypothetical protein EUX98_g5482 [Antrodiella citrinella]
MATVARYIYSHYDPPKPEEPVSEPPQHNADNESDPWQTESAFGARNRLARAPQFVPATISYDEVNDMIGASVLAQQRLAKEEGSKEDVAGWYRSLTRGSTGNTPVNGTSTTSPSGSQAPLDINIPQHTSKSRLKTTKNDWFIHRALRGEPKSAPATPPPTLADILSREPPALSKESALRPPVFLTIGPSNRGFTMLERSGWTEGEPLGPHVLRRGRATGQALEGRKKVKREDEDLVVREEQWEVPCGSDDDVSEVRKVEVVDLTLSDSDEEEEDMDELNPSDTSKTGPDQLFSHDGTALLTPIPTILKADRLGIGLKAKTEGPFRKSKKRVTHNQAALATHIRTTEETKRMKKAMGRGTRAFARAAKKESEQRRHLLASLNDP